MGLKSPTVDPRHKTFYSAHWRIVRKCYELWRAKLGTDEVWAPSRPIQNYNFWIFLMRLKSTQCWPESEWTLAAIASLRFWWGILRKSSIRTTCIFPLQVVKHLNQRRLWFYKVWAPSKIIIFKPNSVDLSQKEFYRSECSGEASCARILSEQHLLFRGRS